jgi:bacillolysin
MPGKLQILGYHVASPGDYTLEDAGPSAFRSLTTALGAPEILGLFHTDEAAARHYLEKLFSQDSRAALRSLAGEEAPGVVPDLQLSQTRVLPKTNNHQLTFVQTVASSLPVFGSNVTVEMNPNRDLVSVAATVSEPPQVSPLPSLTPQQALEAIRKSTNTGSPLTEVKPPGLCVYKDDKEKWHLVYDFHSVPAVPKEVAGEIEEKRKSKVSGHGFDLSPRDLAPLYDYLVDAHTADIVFYYSAVPNLALPVPAQCTGGGEDGNTHNFYGKQIGAGFEMTDPLRSIKTIDLAFRDIAITSVPSNAISNGSNNWGNARKDAVSAHVNLERVFDFYNSVLFRDSVDDKRMQLNGVVSCFYSGHGPGPEWHNAIWWRNSMWFGQRKLPTGQFESYSKYLDVIAHELTHGVTQYTCNLVYRNQSGALNESISDIFGVIIANCYQAGGASVQGWSWEIGAGLGSNGGPLRDFSNPTVTGDPDHMNNYVQTSKDSGGVHTNSNIHNKAAYNLLISTDQAGAAVFVPKEIALFYYLALTRLSTLAGFADMKQALRDVVNSYYIGSAPVAQAKTAAVDAAYAAVGI